jgi:hypothetical protein
MNLEDQVLPLHLPRWMLLLVFGLRRLIPMDDLELAYPTTYRESIMLFNATRA